MSRVEPLAKTARLAVAGQVLRDDAVAGRRDAAGDLKPGQKRARGPAARRGRRRARDPARRALREGRQARRLPQETAAASTPVEVDAGARASRRVVVDSGLAAGDVIALRDPTAKRAQRADAAPGAPRRARARDRPAGGARVERSRACATTRCARSSPMLGIIFGVGAVIAMLSIGAGAERAGARDHRRDGPAERVVRAKRFDRENELHEIRKKSLGLSLRDAQAIREAVPGVELRGRRRSRSSRGRCCRPRAAPSRACSASPPTTRELVTAAARRGPLLRRARRGAPRAGLRDRRRGAARPVRLRAGARASRSRSTTSG